MKEIINKHIMEHRNSMFREATNSVRIKLATICDELEHQLLTNVDATITDLKSQYQHVIIGKDLAEVSTAARDKISGILSRTDTMFQIPVSNDKQPFSAKKESDSAA